MYEKIIKINKIGFKLNDQKILSNISFDIKRCDFIGLFGPNGAGKTTLIKLLLGILKPSFGNIHFIKTLKIGYVPQKQNDDNYFPASVSEILGIKNLSGENNCFNLIDIKSKLFNTLSGGQKQKVIISLSLIDKPDLIILDEPTNGLDLKSQNILFNHLHSINSSGVSVILISHDIDMVVKEVKQVLCLNKELTKNCAVVDFKTSDIENLYGHNYKIIEHKHKLL